MEFSLKLLSLLASKQAPVDVRADAARQLAASDDTRVYELLRTVASDEAAPDELSLAAGEALAVYLYRNNIHEALDLSDLTGSAYVAFDDKMTELIG